MRQASKRIPESAEKTVRDIRRATRRHHSAEEKIRIVLEGLRGEVSIAELCRKEGINQNLYYRWSKEFLEAGKKRLAGDTAREATSDEVKELKAEARQLKETLAEVLIENRSCNMQCIYTTFGNLHSKTPLMSTCAPLLFGQFCEKGFLCRLDEIVQVGHDDGPSPATQFLSHRPLSLLPTRQCLAQSRMSLVGYLHCTA